MLTQNRQWPGICYPRCPGHEITGAIDEIGPAAPPIWQKGQRVGVGWNGGYCGYCNACRHGDFIDCENLQIPGISYDGGYSQYVIVPAYALVALPDELSFVEAALFYVLELLHLMLCAILEQLQVRRLQFKGLVV